MYRLQTTTTVLATVAASHCFPSSASNKAEHSTTAHEAATGACLLLCSQSQPQSAPDASLALQPSSSPTSLSPGGICWNWRHIFDPSNLESGTSESAKSGLCARSRRLCFVA